MTDVHLSIGGVGRYHLFVRLRKTHEGQPKNVILCAFGAHYDIKQVVVVDEDVEVHDPQQVEWATATRFQADRDLVMISGAQGSVLDPSTTVNGGAGVDTVPAHRAGHQRQDGAGRDAPGVLSRTCVHQGADSGRGRCRPGVLDRCGRARGLRRGVASMNKPRPQRLVVAITGASGAIYGVRILQRLRRCPAWESHLVLSHSGALTAAQELALKRSDIEDLADVVHNVKDIGASVASGSFPTEGMVIAPCSMKTLAAIALGLADNLVSRAADVAFEERRARRTAGARNAAEPGAPAQHGQRDRNGRDRIPARAGVLQPPRHAGRCGQPYRGPGPGPVRHRP